MINWFKKKKEVEIYQIVKVIEEPNFAINGKTGRLYIYLSESNFGNRKMETRCETPDHLYMNVEIGGPSYRTKIYPWIKGNNFSDIPTYKQIIYKNQSHDKKFSIGEIYKLFFKK